MDALTIVFLVVAVAIFLKLRSTLGRRTGEDEARIERYKAQQRAAAAAAGSKDNVVTLPRRERPAPADPGPQPDNSATVEAKLRSVAGANAALGNGLVEIWRADRSFEPEGFLRGAKQAYEMVVTAFAEGNRNVLKGLLSRDVFDGFSNVITDREAAGHTVEQKFVGISEAELVEAGVRQGTAHVAVKFVSELISVTKDKSGTVVAGDMKRTQQVIDIWTFARETSSSDPNWKLVATESPG